MFTVKHIREDGLHDVFSCLYVEYWPSNYIPEGYQVSCGEQFFVYFSKDRSDRRSLSNGEFYVMNETGATVAKYFVARKTSSPASPPPLTMSSISP